MIKEKLLDLFELKDPYLREEFANALEVKNYSKNDILFQVGDTIDKMNILVSGLTKKLSYSKDGKERIIVFGFEFGEILLPPDYDFNNDYICQVFEIVIKDSVTLEIDIKRINELREKYKEFDLLVEKKRLYYIHRYINDIQFLKCYNGYDLFCYYARSKTELVKLLTHADIAAFLGITDRNITEYFKKLKVDDPKLYMKLKRK